MFLIYSPEGPNVYGVRVGEFECARSVYMGWKL